MTDYHKMDVICRYKDTNSSNLNKVFDSYGLSTLEAKVPVVTNPVIGKLESITGEQQRYATMALQSESASMAVEGRRARTRNSDLRVVEVNGQTMISIINMRDRSPPPDPNELDKDIEDYMRERKRIKSDKLVKSELTIRPKGSTGGFSGITTKMSKIELSDRDLDEDLDAYMREAARQKAQKKILSQTTDRDTMMRDMEEFDNHL